MLTLIFNQRQTKAASLSATISADTYSVGAAYGGTVIKQYVRDGDSVATGDKLFTIQSVSLQQDVANGLKMQSSPAYDVDTTMGSADLHAPRSPARSAICRPKLGNSLGTGEPFAKITVTNSQYIDAQYLLSPRDYGRMRRAPRPPFCCPTTSALPAP